MSIGVLLRGFIGDMMDFGDVILYTLFPSFMTIQACSLCRLAAEDTGYRLTADVRIVHVLYSDSS